MSDPRPIPFFQIAEADADSPKRRLLIISYHFPPDRAIGARRWEKLARYAAERGFTLDVITCRDTDAPLSDADRARLNALPAGTRLYAVPLPDVAMQRIENGVWSRMRDWKTRASVADAAKQKSTAASTTTKSGSAGIRAPDSLTKERSSGALIPALPQSAPSRPESYAREEVRWALGSVRGYLRLYWSWLDFVRIGTWGKHVARLATQLARANKAAAANTEKAPASYAAVVSSGPPHMSHDAGRRISEQLGIPFVMDMRDPWRLGERLAEGVATPFWFQLADRYESRAVAQATLVVANTEVACRNLRATYPTRSRDIMTVMNGADDDPLPPSRRCGQFVIAHAGTVYLDRDPRGLFQAAARVIRELGATPADFRLAFMGELAAVGGFPVLDVAQQEGIADYVTIEPSQPHAKAMEFMASATMLVTMSGSNMAAIPAKTFECIRFEAWVLALSAPDSATALLLHDSGADVAAPADVRAIEAAIRRRYVEYRDGVCPPRIGNDLRFSRQAQAALLFDALEERLRPA